MELLIAFLLYPIMIIWIALTTNDRDDPRRD